MKINCIDIEWDTDGDEEILATLPTEVIVDLNEIEGFEDEDVTEENSSDIADYLSDEYGFCIFSFNYQTLNS